MADSKGFIYEFGRFAVDPEDRTLLADGTPIHLPAKEFDTLLFLIEHNRKAVSKEEMMSAIWQDSFVEESNLAKQISRLRKILHNNGAEFIETVPKHGYRFSADLRRVQTREEDPILLEKRTVKRLTLAFENEADPLHEPQPALVQRRSPALIAAAVGLLAITAIGAIWWSRAGQPAGAQINTIAVLPLRSLDNNEDGKALGLGLADAVITKLGSARRIIVRPTNAIAAFEQGDAAEIGRRLKVDAVLEGTIQQADGRLRVNARLLSTQSGQQLWTEMFEEPAGGIFKLQDAISANIAKALAFELKSDAQRPSGTQNAEAYEKYLRGRYYQGQNTPDGLTRSIELYQQAAALDPNFAEAHAGIADANVLLFNFGLRPAKDTLPVARQEVERSLKLDPQLSDAYTCLALIQFLDDRDWPAAEKSLQHALELDPNNSDAFLRYGYFLTNVGQFDAALEKLQRAKDLNPLSPIVQADIGLTYLCARRYQEAVDQLQRTADENPQFPLPQWLLGTTYQDMGDAEKAFSANLKALSLDGNGAEAAHLQAVRDNDGLDAANRAWFDESVRDQQREGNSALPVALRAAANKDRDQTLFWLTKAADDGDRSMAGIRYLATFDFVRDDPQFKAVESRSWP